MTVQITIRPSGHAFPCEPDETVLQAAMRADLMIPYGCRNGACGTCKGRILDGSVDFGPHQPSTLTDDEKRKGLALFCVARPQTDCVIEVREVRRAGDIQIKRLPCRVESIAKPAPDVAVGGHSYGGRVASLAAAEPEAPYAALVLFSYPLHPPGRPENTEARIAHWPSIRCPVLLLSGESDPFARMDLLRAAVPRLGGPAELVTYPKLGHGLVPVLDDVLDRVAAFLASHVPQDSSDPLP
jgi:ferredoxin